VVLWTDTPGASTPIREIRNLATSTRKSRGVSSGEYASDKGEWSQPLGLEGIGTIHVAYGS
jgi:hypothetical protein